MKFLLSVIVPVYNAEKYLHECLDHLVKMGDRAQIVLADDESTDNSYSICAEYESKYSNIVLLHEKNGGPSKARNLALSAATGKYIVFCDSDDWLDERIIDELEKFESQDIDFFQFGVNGDDDLLYDDVTILDENQRLDLFSLIVGMRDRRNINHAYFGLVTCKIFRRELVENLLFDPQVVGEDTLYAVQAFGRVNTVVFLPCRYYYYRIVDGSYSRRPFPNIVPMAIRMLEQMSKVLPDCELMRNAYDCHAIDKFWWCFYATTEDRSDYKMVYSRLKELYNMPEFNSAFKNKSIHPNGLGETVKFGLLHTGALRTLALLISIRSS